MTLVSNSGNRPSEAAELDGQRDVMALAAASVAVITVESDGELAGMTITSMISVSLAPPLVLVSLARDSRTCRLLRRATAFALNVLSSEQMDVAVSFAMPGPKDFGCVAHRPGRFGSPVFDDALACLECTVCSAFCAGDHELIVGRTRATRVAPGTPLVYWQREFRRLALPTSLREETWC